MKKDIARTEKIAKMASKGKLPAESEQENKSGRKSQATLLVDLVSNAELFHTPDQEAGITVIINEHKETMFVKEKAFHHYIMRLFFEEHGKTPHEQALKSALGVLTGKALYKSPLRSIFVRIAEHDNSIFIDLANDNWEVIKITREGWEIMPDSPVKFRRPNGILPLPYPIRGGHIDELRQFINYGSEQDFILIASWLLSALNPRGPYVILTLYGEHGSAKSSLARTLRSLVDPNKAPLRSKPRDSRDLMIAAVNGWVIVFDNLSYIDNELSDNLCRLATGGAFATRRLFTDSEEILFEAKRPIILNGIEEVASRPDLVDRLLTVYLPSIPEEKRLPERKYNEAFELARPRILGVLFDALAVGLENIGKVELANLPRMADYAEWVTAIEPAFGWPLGTFLAAYKNNRNNLNALSLEASIIVQPLEEFLTRFGDWEDTATSLLRELGDIADNLDPTLKKQRQWPKNAKLLSGQLRRIAPNLRATGIEVDFRKSSERKIQIRRISSSNGTGADAMGAVKPDLSHNETSVIPTKEIGSIFASKENQQELL